MKQTPRDSRIAYAADYVVGTEGTSVSGTAWASSAKERSKDDLTPPQLPHHKLSHQQTHQQSMLDTAAPPPPLSPQSASSQKEVRLTQWGYIVPVATAPFAHILVTHLKTFPKHRRPLLWAIAATTAATVGVRMVLMADSGYPGAERAKVERIAPA